MALPAPDPNSRGGPWPPRPPLLLHPCPDDTRILKHIANEGHVIELQKDLDAVIICATESSNNMVLHEDKFEALVHKHNSTWTEFDELPFKISSMIYSTFNGDLIPVEHLRDLGVTVTANL